MASNAEEHHVDLNVPRTSNNILRRPPMPSSVSDSADQKCADCDPPSDRSETGPLVELSSLPIVLPPLTKAVTKLSEHQTERERFDAFSRLPPLYILPARPKGGNSYGWPKQPYWLPERVMSTSWLTLFYDLVMVAVLNTFATVHETNRAGAVGIFWSYFCLIWWLWVSQMVYDIRFSAEDIYHRLFKLLQIFVFIYIGAASGGWSPTKILTNDDVFRPEATDEAEASTSFTAVTIAYAASRLVSAVQYLVLMIVARRTGRPVPSLAVPFIGTCLSCALCVVAASLDATTEMLAIDKPVLLYVGIFIEVMALVWTPFLRSYIPIPSHALSERIGALTLIILGEGLLGLVSTFNTVISGFSASDRATYLEVFCAVLIVYFIWMFYFTGFDARHWMGRRRAWFWAVLHMPLHFTIMLLLQGMVNSIKFAAFEDGVNYISDKFLLAFNSTFLMNGTEQSEENRSLALQLGKLTLDPPWQQEYAIIQEMLRSGNASPDPASNEFPNVEMAQYMGQIFVSTALNYKIDISEAMSHAAQQLWALNATLTGNAAVDNATGNEAWAHYGVVQIEGYNSAMEGTLWLLPAAGGVLFLVGVVNCVRYYFKGMRPPYYDISQITVGVALSLLGMLAIGPKQLLWSSPDGQPPELVEDGQNKIFLLDVNNWLLPIPTIVYVAFWLGGMIALLIRRRVLGQRLLQQTVRDSPQPPSQEAVPESVPEKVSDPEARPVNEKEGNHA